MGIGRAALAIGTTAVLTLLAGCAGMPGAGPSTRLPEDAVGTWASTENPDVHLEIADDGSFTGSDGCNGFGGEYTVASDSLELEPGLSTLMACPGMETWLHDAASVTVSGDLMEVYAEDGERIGSLTRA